MDRKSKKWIFHQGNGSYIKEKARTSRKLGCTGNDCVVPPGKWIVTDGNELGQQSESQARLPSALRFLQRSGLGPLLCYVMGLNEFSGLKLRLSEPCFRAVYEQGNFKVGLISAFDRHTNINRSISADHALAHALEFGGERRNLEKVSSFHYLTMYLNSFVPKTKHNCGCVSQVCIYKGIFRFWSALCGLLGDKCSIASSCLVHKTSTVHMAFFNSLRGAKQLLSGGK